jgi:hypothetical protein
MDPSQVTLFGLTDARGKRVPFGIKQVDRSKHMYVIGKTGMGKSTLLENMAIQDIQNGGGLAFIDPHGETAEKLLDYVPEHRIKDVVYFAPFDLQYPISFNVLEQVDVDKRHFVVSGLMSTFEKIWADTWSARMSYILQNTIAALLEYPDATLLGINRMLVDKDYRKKVVESVKDPGVKSFWIDEFAKYTERFAAEATPAIQNKVGQFGSNALVRNVIGQPQSAVDFRKLMDEGKIVIINLSKGLVGENNAVLLGGLLITKIYLAAMSRADVEPEARKKLPAFNLYVDEFQSFANRSFADILSEARKYRLNLTMAHQYIEQMEEEVQAAVFGNVGTMVTFRVGAMDSELLEKEFGPQFTAQDLVSLGFTQICLKLMIDGVSSAPFSALTMPPIPKPAVSFKGNVIHASRATYAKPRAEVEEVIRNWHETKFAFQAQPKSKEEKIEPTKIISAPAKQEVKKEIIAPVVIAAAPKMPPQMPPEKSVQKKQSLGEAIRDAKKEWGGESAEIPAKPPAVRQHQPRYNPSKPKSDHASALKRALDEALKSSPKEDKNQIAPKPKDFIQTSPPPEISSTKEVPEKILRQILDDAK